MARYVRHTARRRREGEQQRWWFARLLGPAGAATHAYPHATLAPDSASSARRGCGTGRRLGCRAVALGCTLRCAVSCATAPASRLAPLVAS